MTRAETERAAARRTPLALPPLWSWTTVVLALVAFLPMAAATGRWRWTPTTGPLVLSLLTVAEITSHEAEAAVTASHTVRAGLRADDEPW